MDQQQISTTEKFFVERQEVERDFVCPQCLTAMKPYSLGIGTECRCKNCGYKDPCCE